MSHDPDLDPADRTSHRRPTAPPRRRRATSPGTGPVGEVPPVVGRAPDDSDVGWGGRPEDGADRRYLEDRPPHWGSD